MPGQDREFTKKVEEAVARAFSDQSRGFTKKVEEAVARAFSDQSREFTKRKDQGLVSATSEQDGEVVTRKLEETAERIKGMRLDSAELQQLDARYIDMAKKVQENSIEFVSSESVAFTPEAMLIVALAKFAYDVYKDHRGSVTVEDLQQNLVEVAKELERLEAGALDSMDLVTYARLRQDMMNGRFKK